MIEVVGMVYKSPAFAQFIADQVPGIRLVGNDATQELRSYASNRAWNFDLYYDRRPNDHYLSRVYRCWNYCVQTSLEEYVCLVNSDMAFSPGWLDALAGRLDGHTLPVSRLVEPGFIRPGQHALEIDLGRDPGSFPMEAWHKMAADLREDRVEPGGLFMPCIVHRETFLAVGGYPEGNIVKDNKIVSGDADLFSRMEGAGYSHVTCFDSLVYHMQEGEMRSAS